MINLFRKFLVLTLKKIGLKKEMNLSLRYPMHKFGEGTYGNLKIRDFMGTDLLEVGSYTSIGPDVQVLLGANHRPDWATTYPFNINFSEYKHITGHPKSNGDVKIGNDVWIGTEAIIMSGVTVGDGAVIGARALVTKDIPAYGIALGMPAKLVQYRFDPDIIEELLEIRWWDWPIEKIKKAVPDLLNTNISNFISNSKEGKYD